MKLKKLLEIIVNYNSRDHHVRIDGNKFLCLTDMAKGFPKKSVKDWLKLKSTNELIQFLNGENSPYLKLIETKKGRYNSGTFACEDLAVDFAMWLCPFFKIKVIRTFRQHEDLIQSWNRSRIASSLANRLISDAIEEVKDDTKPYHHSNEARMINKIVFGRHEKGIRDLASNEELELLNKLLSYSAAYIAMGMDYHERKVFLSSLAMPKAVNE
ncbi:MAG: KilA-N domain-containing protein [Lentisphaeraceae bacterium]|nr:KilA-N domain-containing protein [Lentisphaeraceae bacterium]